MTEAVIRGTSRKPASPSRSPLIGISSNPHHVMAHDDGEVRPEFSIRFRARR
jgi:hypothetical protein